MAQQYDFRLAVISLIARYIVARLFLIPAHAIAAPRHADTTAIF